MNTSIRKEINKRYKLLRRAQKTEKGSTEWNAYKIQHNKCTSIVRKSEPESAHYLELTERLLEMVKIKIIF